MQRHVVLLGLVSATGCVADLEVSSITQAAKKQPGDCETYGCGGNSPEAEGKLFWTQHELGDLNNEGIGIIGFGKKIGATWQELRPDVVNGQLLARDKRSNAIVLKGPQLVGAQFTLKDTITLNHYYVTIGAVGETSMWAQKPTPGQQTFDYELVYYSDTNPLRRNLCKAAGQPTGDSTNPFRAVLFDDDRIDPDNLVVNPEEPDWFTIGCAGSALAKMHLTGNTKAGSEILHTTTTISERTAFLKMITSDICGTGHAFTVAGMRLHYRDVYGHMSSTISGEAVEGLWDANGAICLNTPRVEFGVNSTDPVALLAFDGSISDELERFRCSPPPPCRPPTYGASYSFGGAYVVSTNY